MTELFKASLVQLLCLQGVLPFVPTATWLSTLNSWLVQVQEYIVRYTVRSSPIVREFDIHNPTPHRLVQGLLKDNAPVEKYPNIRYKMSSSTRLLDHDTPLEEIVSAFAENLIELTLDEGAVADWIKHALAAAKTTPVSCAERVELTLSFQHPDFFRDPETVFKKLQLKFANIQSHVKIGNQTKIDVSVQFLDNCQAVSSFHIKSNSVDTIFEEDLEEDRFEILCFFLYFLGRPFPKLQKKTVNRAFEYFESLYNKKQTSLPLSQYFLFQHNPSCFLKKF